MHKSLNLSAPSNISFLSISQVQESIETLPETGRAPSVAETNSLPVIYLSPIVREALPELKWAVEGFITEPGVTLVAGAAKSGKSQFVIRMLCALASGRSFLDTFAVPRRRKILYISGEDWWPNIIRRIRAHALDAGFVDDTEIMKEVYPNIQIVPVCGLRLDDEQQAKLVMEVLEKLQYDVLVIDPLARFHNLDEDKASGMAPLIRMIREIGDTRVVVVVHHEGKRSEGRSFRPASLGHRSRGTSAFADLHDNYVAITKTKAGFRVEREHKYEATPDPVEIDVEWIGERVHWQTQEVVSAATLRKRLEAYVSANPGLATSFIKSGVTGKAESITATLAELRSEGRLRVGKDGNKKLWYLS